MTIKHHVDSLLVLLSFDYLLLTVFQELHCMFFKIVVTQVLSKQICIIVLTLDEVDFHNSIFNVVFDEMVVSVDVLCPCCRRCII